MPNARHSSKRMKSLGMDISNYKGSEPIPGIVVGKFLEPQIATVSIRCLKPMIVKIVGEVTKTEYIFNGAGSILNINAEDVESIMRRNKSIQSCCGSYSSPYFEIL